MSGASYNRGSLKIARDCASGHRAPEFVMMDDLNAEPKDEGAARPFGVILICEGHGGWWATCPVSGFGFWHRTLRDAVRSYLVTVVSVDQRGWTCKPLAAVRS